MVLIEINGFIVASLWWVCTKMFGSNASSLSFSFSSKLGSRNLRQFIHSFIPAISIAPLQVLYYSEALPTTARILYRSFTPKRTATAGKGLAQGPYMAARAGVEPTTLRLRVIASTNAPPCPTLSSWLQWRRSFLYNFFRVPRMLHMLNPPHAPPL